MAGGGAWWGLAVHSEAAGTTRALRRPGPCLFFLYFWLCWVFAAAWAFSSCGKWEPRSRCGAQASPCGGFSCWAQYLWHTDLAVPWLVESSQTRHRTPAVAGGFFFFNYESTITHLRRLRKYRTRSHTVPLYLIIFLSR